MRQWLRLIAGYETFGIPIPEFTSLQPDVVRMVLDAFPAAAAEKDSKGNLPLHVAIDLPRHFAVNVGACVEVWDMLFAARDGNKSIEVVEMLLKAYPDAARERNRCELLPLHVACECPHGSMHPDVVRMVLDAYPAAAAEKDSTGNLPLHLATKHGACVEVVGMLLKAHRDAARERNTDQEFPLFCSDYCRAGCRGAPSGVAQMLIDAYPTAVDLLQMFLQDRRDVQEEGSDSGGD